MKINISDIYESLPNLSLKKIAIINKHTPKLYKHQVYLKFHQYLRERVHILQPSSIAGMSLNVGFLNNRVAFWLEWPIIQFIAEEMKVNMQFTPTNSYTGN